MAHSRHTLRLYQRGSIWWADIRSATGRQRLSTGTPDRAEAESIARAFLDETRQARENTLGSMLRSLWGTKWAHTKSAVQLKYVVPAVERDIGHILLTELTYNHLRFYVERLREDGKSDSTINRRMSLVSFALREAHRMGLIETVPSIPRLREPPPKDRYLSLDEEAEALAYIRKQQADEEADKRPEWHYMEHLVITLLDTGMRLSEALTLSKDNIHGDTIRLRHGTTKSNKGRSIPLTPRAVTAVQALVAHELHGSVSVDWAGHRWGRVRAAADIEDVTLHTLRHTCASRLVAAGVDLYRVSRWLGHSSVKVTERYAHLAPDALDGAREALTNLINPEKQ